MMSDADIYNLAELGKSMFDRRAPNGEALRVYLRRYFRRADYSACAKAMRRAFADEPDAKRFDFRAFGQHLRRLIPFQALGSPWEEWLYEHREAAGASGDSLSDGDLWRQHTRALIGDPPSGDGQLLATKQALYFVRNRKPDDQFPQELLDDADWRRRFLKAWGENVAAGMIFSDAKTAAVGLASS